VTYTSLDARSNALARGLESVGVRKGDRVGVMLGNSMEYAVVSNCVLHSRRTRTEQNQATYALFKLGAILVSHLPRHSRINI
jgi:acyl-CoA synthetase (AMP-forming)/AMP-acid ligase II